MSDEGNSGGGALLLAWEGYSVVVRDAIGIAPSPAQTELDWISTAIQTSVVAGSGYLLAVGATLLAHGATVALKQNWPTPSFMFFIPAVAISAWFGGLGPSILATAMSLALIRINFLGPGLVRARTAEWFARGGRVPCRRRPSPC